MIASVAAVCDLDQVVIGGGVAKAGPVLFDPLREALRTYAAAGLHRRSAGGTRRARRGGRPGRRGRSAARACPADAESHSLSRFRAILRLLAVSGGELRSGEVAVDALSQAARVGGERHRRRSVRRSNPPPAHRRSGPCPAASPSAPRASRRSRTRPRPEHPARRNPPAIVHRGCRGSCTAIRAAAARDRSSQAGLRSPSPTQNVHPRTAATRAPRRCRVGHAAGQRLARDRGRCTIATAKLRRGWPAPGAGATGAPPPPPSRPGPSLGGSLPTAAVRPSVGGRPNLWSSASEHLARGCELRSCSLCRSRTGPRRCPSTLLCAFP